MATSNGPILLPDTAPAREPLRLRMAEHPGRNHLDGGWWPHSRDLATEFAALVDQFPVELGRIVRAVYSPPDWDGAVRRVQTATGHVKLGSFPRDDTHLVDLRMSDRSVLRVLVIPPSFSDGQGSEALLAAATAGNRHAAEELLEMVTDSPDVDPRRFWHQDGEARPAPR